MQLFALDIFGHPISAREATGHIDYRCLECDSTVRKRSGPHRQPHFFHLRESPSCFLSGKGMVHLQIQWRLFELFPRGECELEYRFPSLGRIADVVWLPQRLIFEVQCSSISREELAARNRDYASLGFQVVWILHDSRYNQRLLSSAEQELKEKVHYFSNIDQEGNGLIYDQFDVKKRNRRTVKLGKLPIDLSCPKTSPQRPLYFAGDLHDLKKDSPYILEAKKFQTPFWKILLRPYQILLQIVLEWACK
jgi:competence protein CoiA